MADDAPKRVVPKETQVSAEVECLVPHRGRGQEPDGAPLQLGNRLVLTGGDRLHSISLIADHACKVAVEACAVATADRSLGLGRR